MTNNGEEPPFTLRLEHYDDLDSTQDEMHRRLDAGEDIHGLVIRTEHQTRGRGQRQYDWRGEPGGSYQTLAIRDRIPTVLNTPHAALYVALGIAHSLREYGVTARIKWPNDLYYRGKKLAGILTEYRQAHLLVGVGMNVNNPVPETATGLRGWATETVHALVLAGLERGLTSLFAHHDVVSTFSSYDLLKGQEVQFAQGDTVVTGIARGIDASGRLKLELPDGTLHTFASGRITNLSEVLDRMQSGTRC